MCMSNPHTIYSEGGQTWPSRFGSWEVSRLSEFESSQVSVWQGKGVTLFSICRICSFISQQRAKGLFKLIVNSISQYMQKPTPSQHTWLIMSNICSQLPHSYIQREISLKPGKAEPSENSKSRIICDAEMNLPGSWMLNLTRPPWSFSIQTCDSTFVSGRRPSCSSDSLYCLKLMLWSSQELVFSPLPKCKSYINLNIPRN